MANNPYTLELKSKSPFVVLPLKQYEKLVEYIEDLEDKAALLTRKPEENVSWANVEKKFNKKFGVK